MAAGRGLSAKVAVLAAVAMLAIASGRGAANTPGRAWTPVERLNEPGFAYLIGPHLEAGRDGVPLMAVSGIYGPAGDDGLGYRWGGTGWVRTWSLGQPPGWFWPVLSPPGTSYLVWTDQCCLDLAQLTPQGVAERETVATIFEYRFNYSAAVSAKRRWAAVRDYDQILRVDALRVFSSASLRSWHETRLGDIGAYGVALAPLDDTTAVLAAVADNPRLIALWRAGDTEVSDTGIRTGGVASNGPRFRPRPSGGLWLAWGTEAPYVALATYRSGSLDAPDTLRSAYRFAPPWAYGSTAPDMSRDAAEFPAVAWGSDLQTGGSVLCVSVPTDVGFSVADEIPNAAAGTPSVARDLNGDVWVASWEYFDTANWVHTYTIATCSTPRLSGAGRERTVAWTLSEPAPETWWAVLRSVNGGPFESITRVRAGASLEMTFTDAPPTADLLAYKIQRECADTRYVWESEPVTVGVGAKPPIYLGPPVENPGDLGGDTGTTGIPEERRWDRLSLTLTGADAGPLAVRVYDLQGRQVLRRDTAASGGREPFAFDLAAARRSLAMGVYFLRVTDAGGRASNAVRFVILK